MHTQHGTAERDGHVLPGVLALCTGDHKMDGKGSTLATCVIGRCVMQCLAVVKHHTTGGQFDNFGFGYLHLIFNIKQRIGLR